jgi:hypothetical protein
MTEEEFFQFINRMEREVYRNNFPEYEKEEEEDDEQRVI